MGYIYSKTLCDAATGTGTQTAYQLDALQKVYHLTGATTASTGAATVKVQVSNDNTNWVDLGTLSLTLGTTVTSDSFVSSEVWLYHRANVTAISGTGANVTLIASYGG